MNIYISNLSFTATDDDLVSLFTPYGEVSSAKVIADKFTGKSRGFGFVEIKDDEAAKKAISELDNKSIDGRALKITEARPKEERSSNSFKKNRW